MKDERGFTLVETLIAFAILAVVLVALYEAMGTSMKGVARASRFDEAVLALESRLAEITLLSAMPTQLEGEEGGYHWRILPISDEAQEAPELAVAPIRAQKVRLVVEWRESGLAKSISVDRILLLDRQTGR